MTDPSPVASAEGPGRVRQGLIYRAGVLGHRPTVPADFAELERRAAGGHVTRGPGPTSPAGPARVRRCGPTGPPSTGTAIVPRMLPRHGQRDLSTELLGRPCPPRCCSHPIGRGRAGPPRQRPDDRRGGRRAAGCPTSCPTRAARHGGRRRGHGDARGGSSSTGRPTSRWSTASWPVPRRAVPRPSSSPSTRRCSGWRPQDLNLGSLPFSQGIGIAQYTSDPRFQEIVAERVAAAAGRPAPRTTSRSPSARCAHCCRSAGSTPATCAPTCAPPRPAPRSRRSSTSTPTPALTWEQLATLRERTVAAVPRQGRPAPGRRRRAVEAGASGVVVSNHGGRQVDGADRVPRRPPGRPRRRRARTLPVVLDSGVRTGSDVVKAIALGADAVAIGRPLRLRAGPGRARRRAGRAGQHRGRARPHDGPVRGRLGGRDRTRPAGDHTDDQAEPDHGPARAPAAPGRRQRPARGARR